MYKNVQLISVMYVMSRVRTFA